MSKGFGSRLCATGFLASGVAAPLDVPLDEPVGILFQRRVIADLPDSLCRAALVFVRRRAACDRAGLLAGLDARIVSEPAHAFLSHDSPEAVVDRLQQVDERRPREDGAGAESPAREAAPPDVGFGKRANGRA